MLSGALNFIKKDFEICLKLICPRFCPEQAESQYLSTRHLLFNVCFCESPLLPGLTYLVIGHLSFEHKIRSAKHSSLLKRSTPPTRYTLHIEDRCHGRLVSAGSIWKQLVTKTYTLMLRLSPALREENLTSNLELSDTLPCN